MATYTKKQVDEEREMLLKGVERYKEQLSTELLNNSGGNLKAEILERKETAQKKPSIFNKIFKILSA